MSEAKLVGEINRLGALVADLRTENGILQRSHDQLQAHAEKLDADAQKWAGEAERLVSCLSETTKWIPVSERLPPDKEWAGIEAVLAACPGDVFITTIHPSWWNTKDARGPRYDGPIITHWMPLPEAPK